MSNQQAYFREGNIFSRIHRELEGWRCCTDFDYMEFNGGVCQDSGDQVYSEYEPEAGTVKAIFEYKSKASEAVMDNIRSMRPGTSLWFQAKLSETLGCRFFIVLANDGELPLVFLEVRHGTAYLKGELKSDDQESVRRFWRNDLNL